MQKELRDLVLGDHGKIYQSGNVIWGAFKKEFRPTQNQVVIFVDVTNETVPYAQHELYQEIEKWYPSGLPDISMSIHDEMKKAETRQELPTPEHIHNHFRLHSIDIRSHVLPLKCVLHYHADREHFDWYVRISDDYSIESCGEED